MDKGKSLYEDAIDFVKNVAGLNDLYLDQNVDTLRGLIIEWRSEARKIMDKQ